MAGYRPPATPMMAEKRILPALLAASSGYEMEVPRDQAPISTLRVPTRMPSRPPATDLHRASARNWARISLSEPPMAFFRPTSRVRARTAAKVPYQMPKPPSIREATIPSQSRASTHMKVVLMRSSWSSCVAMTRYGASWLARTTEGIWRTTGATSSQPMARTNRRVILPEPQFLSSMTVVGKKPPWFHSPSMTPVTTPTTSTTSLPRKSSLPTAWAGSPYKFVAASRPSIQMRRWPRTSSSDIIRPATSSRE